MAAALVGVVAFAAFAFVVVVGGLVVVVVDLQTHQVLLDEDAEEGLGEEGLLLLPLLCQMPEGDPIVQVFQVYFHLL